MCFAANVGTERRWQSSPWVSRGRSKIAFFKILKSLMLCICSTPSFYLPTVVHYTVFLHFNVSSCYYVFRCLLTQSSGNFNLSTMYLDWSYLKLVIIMCTCIYCALYCLYSVFVLFRLCIFIVICFVCTSERTTVTEWQLNCSNINNNNNSETRRSNN